MGLVMDVCDRIAVLDFGEKIAEGLPARDPERPAGDRGLPGGDRPMLLELEDVHVHYGKVEALKGIVGHRRRGRDRHAHRRQRRRQDHHAEDDLRRAARHQRARSRFEGEDITGVAAAPARRDGHLPGARGPRHLPRHERASRTSRWAPTPARARTPRADLDRVFELFPRLLERRDQAGRHAVRRRAADARHRPGAHGPAEAAAARRAVDGPRAEARRADLLDHHRDQRAGHDDPARRAERRPGAAAGRPGLRARGRPGREVGRRPRTCSTTTP